MTHPRTPCLRLALADLATDAARLGAEAAARLARGGDGVVRLEVVTDDAGAGPARIDLRTVDGLARLGLVVRRAGARLELVGAGTDLCALLHLTGLAAVLGPGSALEDRGQAEDAEVLLADEVGDRADAAVTHLEQVDRPGHPDAAGARLVLGEPP